MQNEGIYWNINDILPYQRLFNFINGPRSIGKTYTTQKWMIKQFLKTGKAFALITRTQNQKNSGLLESALRKVLMLEYPDLEYQGGNETIVVDGKPMAYCFALSETVALKQRSFPDIHFFIFDEYQIESKSAKYLNGMQEPELFVNLYHTVDREENRVKVFFLGNNTSYYNPYHIYPLFGLPDNSADVKPGEIWTNEISLFQAAVTSPGLKELKDNNPFLKALKGTRYGEYAVDGKYRDDNTFSIHPLEHSAKYLATIASDGQTYGLYVNGGGFTFSSKVDPSCKVRLGFDKESIKLNFGYIKVSGTWLLNSLREFASVGLVSYDTMKVKAAIQPAFIKLL